MQPCTSYLGLVCLEVPLGGRSVLPRGTAVHAASSLPLRGCGVIFRVSRVLLVAIRGWPSFSTLRELARCVFLLTIETHTSRGKKKKPRGGQTLDESDFPALGRHAAFLLLFPLFRLCSFLPYHGQSEKHATEQHSVEVSGLRCKIRREGESSLARTWCSRPRDSVALV